MAMLYNVLSLSSLIIPTIILIILLFRIIATINKKCFNTNRYNRKCSYHRTNINRKNNFTPSIFRYLLTIVIVGMIPKLEVLNDSSSSSSNNNNGLIVFAQAQDFVVHYPTDVVPVGPQFIINYTVYTTLYYDGVGTNNLAFEVQPYVTEPSWSGASGAGPGPRIIKMTSDYHQVGNHVIQMDTITNMAPDNLPTGIESITMKYADAADGGFPLTDLPHDAIVLSFIKYTTPTGGSPGAYFTRGNFLFKMDIETDPGTLRSPTSNQGISVRFSLQFVLPEAALPGSLFLNVYPTEGDTNGKRRIKIADTVYQPGVHSIDMDAFSTVASTSSDIASVSPAINMVSQAKYIFGFEYQDSLGNPPTEVNSTNVFHDTETLPPTVIAPISGARVPATFTFTFELPEVGLNQSVMLDIAKTNTKDPDCPTDVNDAGYCPDDTNEDRNIVLMGDFQTIGTHTFTVPVNGLDSLAGSNNNVLRVSPEVDLVHGQQYMFIFRCQRH